MRRVLLTLCALAVAAGLGAGPAQASQLGIGTTCDKYMFCQYVVRYEADPGERNDVRVALTDTGIVVSDAGADIRAPANGCTSITPRLVNCAPMPSAPIVRLDILGGDGDDRIDASALVFTPTLLEGGAGNDIVLGGGSRDTLTGGPGNDALDGRGGEDIASYADHGEDGVRADLHAGSATGAAGERDTLSNFEALRGGPGDDVLIGDGAKNGLTGGGGSDELRGRGADDVLAGAGVLYGDGGDDRLLLKGAGRAVCGAGSADQVSASGTGRVVDGSCEKLRLPAVTVQLQLAHHDPSKARLTFDLIDLSGRVLDARLTTTAARPRLLGSLRRRIPSAVPRGRASMRLSASGAAYVRRSAPLDVLLTLRGRAKVRLHINRH
jgi:hypothetical protein